MKLKKDKYIGEVYENKYGTKFQVIDYFHNTKVTVKDLTHNCIIENLKIGNLKKGEVKSPYDRTIFGVGYLGIGEYYKTKNDICKKAYIEWNSMMTRCYSEKFHKIEVTYINCEVCKEWHDFQNFAKWFEENYYEIDGEIMTLDKDILTKGNKIYSPKNCVICPQRLNTIILNRQNDRGKLPIGVCYHKSSGKYSARCSVGSTERIWIGTYNSPEEAFIYYKKFKENYIKEVANNYKNKIPEKLYQALISYEISIDD